MKIRPMTEDDLKAVLGIIGQHDDDDADAAEAYFERFFKEEEEGRGADRHFVALSDEGAVVGVGGAEEDPEEGDRIWWLGWFYVHPGWQRQGVGEALLARSLDWARSKGGRKIYVDVSALPLYDAARSFYVKHGFVEEGRLRDFYAVGEDCVIMGRTL
jgi:GNAT superfamily N-acetyltransferase